MSHRTVFLLIAAALVLPAPASASTTVVHDGSTTRVTGDAEADEVKVEYRYVSTPGPISGDALRISNPAGVVPGPGCVPDAASSTSVMCPMGDAIAAQLADGDDRFDFGEYDLFALTTTVEGQGGADTLSGSFRGVLDGGIGNDLLHAGDSSDQRLVGGTGADTVELSGYESYVSLGGAPGSGTKVDADVERIKGGNGDDIVAIGPGAGTGHAIDGGLGHDTVSYASAAAPVRVQIGGGGTDTIGGDVESITGTGGDDELVGSSAGNVLRGGGGNDRLVAGDGGDSLLGGDGDDVLDAGAGDDRLDGLAGNDRLDGGAGADGLDGGTGGDQLRGGPDRDRVSYYGDSYYSYYYDDEYYGLGGSSSGSTTSPAGVTLILDDRANDGAAGEGDDVGSDIEVITGSAGDDTIVAGAVDNQIEGYGGKDRIEGGDGDDKIGGGAGDDVIGGGAGKDELRGGGDNDQIDGGPGEDLAIGQDHEEPVDGIDLIELRDGERDAAACSAGLSRVLADQHDIVDQKCALIERFTVGPAGAPPPPTVGPSPLLSVRLKGTAVDRRGIARIRVTCAAAPVPCAGRLSLFTLRKRKLARLGRVVFAVPAGRTRVIRVRLNALGRRLVRTRRSVRTQVFVAHQDPKAKPIRIATIGLRRAR
jgi:Ca2+-binding RTX toxin-like protein